MAILAFRKSGDCCGENGVETKMKFEEGEKVVTSSENVSRIKAGELLPADEL